jgi:hypothetical protein
MILTWLILTLNTYSANSPAQTTTSSLESTTPAVSLNLSVRRSVIGFGKGIASPSWPRLEQIPPGSESEGQSLESDISGTCVPLGSSLARSHTQIAVMSYCTVITTNQLSLHPSHHHMDHSVDTIATWENQGRRFPKARAGHCSKLFPLPS